MEPWLNIAFFSGGWMYVICLLCCMPVKVLDENWTFIFLVFCGALCWCIWGLNEHFCFSSENPWGRLCFYITGKKGVGAGTLLLPDGVIGGCLLQRNRGIGETEVAFQGLEASVLSEHSLLAVTWSSFTNLLESQLLTIPCSSLFFPSLPSSGISSQYKHL